MRFSYRPPWGRPSSPADPSRSYAYRSTANVQPARPDSGVVPVKNAPSAAPSTDTALPTAGGFASSLVGSLRALGARSGSPGRGYIGRTEDDLNTGPVPGTIRQNRHANDRGKIAVGAGPTGIVGFPYDGSWQFIKHNPIPRTPITVTPFARTIDTGVTIPSVGIGNPL